MQYAFCLLVVGSCLQGLAVLEAWVYYVSLLSFIHSVLELNVTVECEFEEIIRDKVRQR